LKEADANPVSSVPEPQTQELAPNLEEAVSGGDPEPSPAPVGASKREALIARAEELASQGDYDHAIATIKQLLLVDPRDCEAIFIVATMVADSGNLSDAITWLDSIPQDHPEAGLAALGQSADWCVQVRRYDEAERRYNEVLKVAPDAYPARRQLAFLLNCQGRREEAAEQIRELCKLGNARQDELHSLVVLSHAMYDAPDSIAREQQADTTGVSYQPIGQGGIARKLFSDGKFAEAAESIEDLIASGEAPDALVALFGRIVTEAQDDEKFN
jgi:tetratricopeptide (TPR) repeat protein